MLTLKMKCEWCGKEGEAEFDYNADPYQLSDFLDKNGYGTLVFGGNYGRRVPKSLPDIKAFICHKCCEDFKLKEKELEAKWIESIKILVRDAGASSP